MCDWEKHKPVNLNCFAGIHGFSLYFSHLAVFLEQKQAWVWCGFFHNVNPLFPTSRRFAERRGDVPQLRPASDSFASVI